MHRRTLLAAVGGSALVAGCLDTGLADGNDGDTNDDEDLLDSIETLGSDCATKDPEWAVAVRADDAIVIDGSTPAPNPCHEATVGSIDIEDGTLSADVGVSSTLESDEVCPECVGEIRYTLTVDPGDQDVDAVDLVHEAGDSVTPDLFDAEDPTTVASADVETVGIESQPDDTAGVTARGTELEIVGTVPAPTPCHLATIERSAITDGELQLEIGLAEDPEVDTCSQVRSGIEYAATIELDGPPFIGEVLVDHVDAETHELPIDR